MKRINNIGERISDDTIQQCFEVGNVLHVDKVICGNGFSTAFLKLKPTIGCVNIIIMPNKGAIKSKELDYFKDMSKYNHNRIGFFYKEGKGGDLSNLDCAVFVADSFLSTESVKTANIDKLLVDEFHSVEKASSYRHNLKDLIYKITQRVSNIKDVALSSVTATPNLSSRVDIVIENETIKPVEIQVSIDIEVTIKAIRELIKNKERVIIFTQNASTIEAILKPTHNQFRKEAIPVNWILGSSLTQGVLEVVKYKHDVDSNIVIVSSKGFEGMDLEEHSDWNVFFFEDRASKIESYLLPNLYQAIHRTRKGHSSVTYCRADRGDLRKGLPDGLQNFIERDDFSGESKMGQGKNSCFSKFHKYVIFEHKEDSSEITVKENEVAIRLLSDATEWDLPASSLHRADGNIKRFCDERSITFIEPNIKERNCRIGHSSTKSDTKSKYLKNNEAVIEELGFFGSSYRFDRNDFDGKLKTSNSLEKNLGVVKKAFAKFQIRRNYKGGNLEELLTRREKTLIKLLKNDDYFRVLIRESIVAKKREYKSRVDSGKMTQKEYRDKTHNIDVVMPLFVIRYACDLVNPTISHKKRIVGHRDYNITIEGSLDAMRVVTDYFDLTFQEVDVRNCFIRVIYSMCGFELPSDVYGENKENKKKINMLLNTITYEPKKFNETFDVDLRRKHRASRVKGLREAGIREEVIDYLVTTYTDSGLRGRFFQDMSYFEKRLLEQLRSKKEGEGRIDYSKNDGVVRRHDSIIIYNNAEDLTNLNNGFLYLNHTGWFDVNYVPLDYQVYLKDLRVTPENGFTDFIAENFNQYDQIGCFFPS